MDVIEKSGEPKITYKEVHDKIKKEVQNSSRIVLPLASIIECGNHITQIKRKNAQEYVDKFAEFIDKSLDGSEPWDIFTNQSELFSKEKLKELVENWKLLSQSGISMGDSSIIQVAQHYDKLGVTAEIFTGDSGLKSFEPAPKPQIFPRNRNRR